jgi:uroporphyrinogen-III synthase
MTDPGAGRRARVLVTRALQDAPPLARRLLEAGLEPVSVPLLELRWRPFAVAETHVAHPDADWVLITSAVAADVVAVGAPSGWRAAKWAAVGPGTAARLLQHGVAPAVVPEPATGEHLVAALGDVTGRTVILPRSELADPALVSDLRARGGNVVEFVCYENHAPAGHVAQLKAALPVDVTTLLSGSAAERLARAIPPADQAALGKLVVIGPTTAEVARRCGLEVHGVAERHDLDGLVAAVRRAATDR